MTTSKGFTGQYNDNLTGLDDYGSRYYDPTAGVFLSADPIEGDLAGANPYEYVNANPETNTDPTGQRVISPGGQQGPLGPINVDNVPVPMAASDPSVVAQLRNVKDLNLQPDACNSGCKTILGALVPHDLPGGGPGSFTGGSHCLASAGLSYVGVDGVLIASPGPGCISAGENSATPSSSPSSRPSTTFWQVVPYTLCTGGYDCSDENEGNNKSNEPGGARESGNLLAADTGGGGDVENGGSASGDLNDRHYLGELSSDVLAANKKLKAAAFSNVTDLNGNPLSDTNGGSGVEYIGSKDAYNDLYSGKCAVTNLCAKIAAGVANNTVILPEGPIQIVEAHVNHLWPCTDCMGNAALLAQETGNPVQISTVTDLGGLFGPITYIR